MEKFSPERLSNLKKLYMRNHQFPAIVQYTQLESLGIKEALNLKYMVSNLSTNLTELVHNFISI
jgi:hypothetical protein